MTMGRGDVVAGCGMGTVLGWDGGGRMATAVG